MPYLNHRIQNSEKRQDIVLLIQVFVIQLKVLSSEMNPAESRLIR